MSVEIFDVLQGSDEWKRLRAGLPTGSEFGTILATGKGGAESKVRRTYLYKLAGERITGEPMESYTNKYMERGTLMEAEAIAYYQMLSDAVPQRVGFIKNLKKGCSPDALIDNNGMLEIKTAAPHILIDVLETDAVPTEHIPQLQGGLWVGEREWIDLLIYYPRMPAFMRRVYRDEEYIARLSSAVDQFNDELEALTNRIKARQ